MDYASTDWIAGTIIMIGSLTIPFVIRRWIVRRPLSKNKAVLISIALGALLFGFFFWAATLVGQQDAYLRKPHVGLVVIAYFSYWILTRHPDSKTTTDKAPAKTHNEVTSPDSPPTLDDYAVRAWARLGTNNRMVLIIASVIVVSMAVYLWHGRTSTYEDCILKNMPQAQTREAAILVKNACYKKYGSRQDKL